MSVAEKPQAEPSVPSLVVDLDSTLVKTDLLYEQLLLLVKKRPLFAFFLPFWTLRGKLFLKKKLSDYTAIDIETLPYRTDVLKMIYGARTQGAQVILASASYEPLVKRIADHLGVFDAVIGSTTTNIKGNAKLAKIRERIGNHAFHYIGDHRADLAIWQESDGAIAINPSHRTSIQLKKIHPECTIIQDKKPSWKAIVKQIRMIQWVKNLLVFLPMICAHELFDVRLWGHASLAALAFSLIASAIYVMNDLIDIDHDRAHPSKKRRPFAAGDLSIKTGFVLFPMLLTAGFALGLTTGLRTVLLMVAYFIANILYSYRFKEVAIADTLVLAGFYTLRILVGGEATRIPVSHWLLAFSVFFFFGLALVKRYTELIQNQGNGKISGRGYMSTDKNLIMACGVSSSFLAIMIFVLYLHSPDSQKLYHHPEHLWAVAPCMLFWYSRLWLLAHRGQLHEDPVIFSIKDPTGWVALGIIVSIFVWGL